MKAVKVRKGYKLKIPASVRKKLAIKVGDLLQVKMQDGGILIVPKSPESKNNSGSEDNNGKGSKVLEEPLQLGRPSNRHSNARSDRRPRYQRVEFEPLSDVIVEHLD